MPRVEMQLDTEESTLAMSVEAHSAALRTSALATLAAAERQLSTPPLDEWYRVV
jgi:hypothetical protein